jgi:hypothetical protein
MFAYALVPFALLPVSIVVFLRLYRHPGAAKLKFGAGGAIAAMVLAIVSLFSATWSAGAFYGPSLIGRIDPDRYHLWNDISRNTGYRDVVFSPVLQAAPIGLEVGVANKVVYPVQSFAQVDQRVERVCGPFNVVLALPPGVDIGAFASRAPSDVIDTGHIRLLRFADYPGKATGCLRTPGS